MTNIVVDTALEGARLNAIIIAAIEHRLFDHVGDRGSQIADIASKSGISVRGCQAIADGLVGLKLWRVSDGMYRNTPSADDLLRSDSESYLGRHQVELFEFWLNAYQGVAKHVESGQPPNGINSDKTKKFWSHLTPMLATRTRKVAEFCVKEFAMDSRALGMLDIGGGGSALYAKALLSANPQATAHQVDWPHINEAAEQYMSSQGLADRFRRIDGDFHDTDFGSALFDVVVISNIIHQESPESVQDLIRRSYTALRPGGRIIVSDWLVDDGRAGPSSSLFFNFTALLLSEDGKTYEKSELGELFEREGFGEIDFLKTSNYETIATGVRG